jgi:asparagine synthase (glutamine-hydrolysing)
MCGIVGIAGFFEPDLLRRMCRAIEHRGPDGEGLVELPESRIAMGMRRLAIIDIEGGQQPFVTPDGQVYLVFNGEVYNFRELRDQLRARGRSFKTNSDTEVVLASYLEWGEEAWSRLQGMFALAIADLRGEQPRLLVVRDRVGMKPLYYALQREQLVFASELKALLQWQGLRREVNLEAVGNYLALRYVPGPDCLLKGISKLPAGHMLVHSAGTCKIERWWAPPPSTTVEHAMDEVEARDTFGKALRTAVRRHLVSDVPVGAFLSGGVDSNVIVALMAEVASDPVHTFSVGFPEFPRDELDRAALTARALGTDHTALECTSSDMAALPDIVWSLDEPVGDPIVVPLYVLAREARRKVKVVLSGEGADELMGGYVFHRNLTQLQTLRGLSPRALWSLASHIISLLPPTILDRFFDYPGSLGIAGRRKVANLFSALATEDLEQLYRRSISLFDKEDIRDVLATQPDTAATSCSEGDSVPGDPLQQLVQLQFKDWLPDLILGKFDKLTMAHSLEGRVPFMDDLVIQAASRIPTAGKLKGKENKKALRDFALQLLPAEIANAPKAAFYIPMETYVGSPQIAQLMNMTLDPARVKRRGLFNPDWIKRVRETGASDGFLPMRRLFAVMMLELWFERFCPDASW